MILLVEDELENRKLFLRVLHGYRVFEAGDGLEAFRIFQENSDCIRLLVSDIKIPGMSGSDLALNIRKIKPNFPILLISGYTDLEDIGRDLIKSGEVHFISKPFPPKDLRNKVEELLS